MTNKRRWVLDEGTIWFEVENGGALEPEEALRNHVDNEYFDDAYDALAELINMLDNGSNKW